MTDTTPRASHESRRGWHLDKSVNLPFLLSLLLAGFAGIAYVVNNENRQTKVETRVETQEKTLESLKADIKLDLTRIENQNIRIESKLDKLSERR